MAIDGRFIKNKGDFSDGCQKISLTLWSVSVIR